MGFSECTYHVNVYFFIRFFRLAIGPKISPEKGISVQHYALSPSPSSNISMVLGNCLILRHHALYGLGELLEPRSAVITCV